MLVEELLEEVRELALVPAEAQAGEGRVRTVLELVHALHVGVEHLVHLVREQLVLALRRHLGGERGRLREGAPARQGLSFHEIVRD